MNPVRGLVSTPCRGGTFDCLCGVLVNTWSPLLETSFKGDLGGVELDCGAVSRVTLLWRRWREGDVWLVGSLFSWREKNSFSTFYKLLNFLVQPPLSLKRPTNQFFSRESTSWNFLPLSVTNKSWKFGRYFMETWMFFVSSQAAGLWKSASCKKFHKWKCIFSHLGDWQNESTWN